MVCQKHSTKVHVIGETDLNWEFRESFLREEIFELKTEEWVEINLEKESEMMYLFLDIIKEFILLIAHLFNKYY